MLKAETQFEIHTNQRGRWALESVVADEDAARERASMMFKKPDVAGVRIIREDWDPKKNLAFDRLIHEELKGQRREVEHRR